MLKKLIGNLTLPKNAEQCELGDWWIESDGVPTGEYYQMPSGLVESRSYKYPYNYQKLEQNWYGKWELQTQWLSRHHSLEVYRLWAADAANSAV